jgi:hypothetical protein
MRFNRGGNVRNALKLHVLGAVALVGAGLLVTGCKSAPPLTTQQAQSMIQAKYDQTAPAGISINVTDLGMRQGIAAKYWERKTMYPNHYWADFTLTPEGKKLVTLPGGGDTIQWRPMSPTDKKYSVIVTTTQANHLKAMNVRNIQSEVLPGASKGMGADFDEVEDFTGVPMRTLRWSTEPGSFKLSSNIALACSRPPDELARRRANAPLTRGRARRYGGLTRERRLIQPMQNDCSSSFLREVTEA